MAETYNVYCDESGHLEHDELKVMVLGAVWCPVDRTKEISSRIRDIQERHGLSRRFEVKWTKVSPSKIGFYVDLIDYFLDNNDLHFRAVVVPDKTKLRHDAYKQDHETWYYKMFFVLLKTILSPRNCYRVYIDIKDTHSGHRQEKLHEVLCNNIYDFHREIIQSVQPIRSNESSIAQLSDLLCGVVSYANRQADGSGAKQFLVQRVRQRSGYKLTHSTLPTESKLNILIWSPREVVE